jgi:glycosyltransferase involved in cell wall biosynthesis
MSEGTSRRLWLVDHLLVDVVGHHLGYNLALAQGAREAGWEPVLTTHRDFPPALAPGCAVQRIFRTDWRAAPPTWMTRHMRLLRLLEMVSGARFATDLRRLSSAVHEADVIFAQMIAPRHFVAWLRWVEEFPRRLVLHLGYQPARFGHPAVRSALDSLSRKAREKVHFVTDSERLTGPFSEILRAPVKYLPHIVDRTFPDSGRREDGAPLRCLSLGNARREKGFADIVQAAGLLEPERTAGAISLTIQCHQPDAESARQLVGQGNGPGLRWIRDPLPDDAYAAELAAADVVLLPYHLDHYALRTSGVFCEARVAGKPIVGSEGSWLGGRIARDGGGWLVPERDPAALAACLREIPRTFSRVSEDARQLAEAARSEFCPRTFVRRLLELYEGRAAA